ncbi:hypothetical protein MNV49_005017 [Pseudohyphozyma bogoriensis]|nr:hypothetical protein MNV49_005017 [Pseudohyphozyma bogoriensis]
MSFIANKVGRKVFAQHAATYEPADPHREQYVDARGRTKSRRRKMPEGLSKRDEKILRSVRRRAHYLDKGFSLCGFRFGWTAIFGLIPFAGDILGFLLSYFLVLRKCRQADLPIILQERMAFNQAVSVGVGLIPLVGDICLAVWKANSRNAALLEEFLIARAAKTNAAANGTGAGEEAMGKDAIRHSKIDKKSGEIIGGGGGGVVTGGAASTTALDPGSTSTSEVRTGKSKWYGWGSGSNSTGTNGSSADVAGVGAGSAAVAGNGKKNI